MLFLWVIIERSLAFVAFLFLAVSIAYRVARLTTIPIACDKPVGNILSVPTLRLATAYQPDPAIESASLLPIPIILAFRVYKI